MIPESCCVGDLIEAATKVFGGGVSIEFTMSVVPTRRWLVSVRVKQH